MGEWKQNPITIPPGNIEELKSRIRCNSDTVPSGCWEWALTRTAQGYGYTTSSGLRGAAHRFSYAAFKGPVPKNTVVRHRCDNPPCVNPDHLELGSQWDNVQDQKKRGTWTSPLARRKKFINGVPVCQKRDHPLVGENIRRFPDGKIACRECHRMSARASNERRKAKQKINRHAQQARVKE